MNIINYLKRYKNSNSNKCCFICFISFLKKWFLPNVLLLTSSVIVIIQIYITFSEFLKQLIVSVLPAVWIGVLMGAVVTVQCWGPVQAFRVSLVLSLYLLCPSLILVLLISTPELSSTAHSSINQIKKQDVERKNPQSFTDSISLSHSDKAARKSTPTFLPYLFALDLAALGFPPRLSLCHLRPIFGLIGFTLLSQLPSSWGRGPSPHQHTVAVIKWATTQTYTHITALNTQAREHKRRKFKEALQEP